MSQSCQSLCNYMYCNQGSNSLLPTQSSVWWLLWFISCKNATPPREYYEVCNAVFYISQSMTVKYIWTFVHVSESLTGSKFLLENLLEIECLLFRICNTTGHISGSGKSFVIESIIKRNTTKQIHVAATTGIAASLLKNAMTLHRFLGISDIELDSEDLIDRVLTNKIIKERIM